MICAQMGVNIVLAIVERRLLSTWPIELAITYLYSKCFPMYIPLLDQFEVEVEVDLQFHDHA